MFQAAISATIPVLLGYLTIGIAFGVMLESIGYNYLWAGLMSLTIYAGSMQYVTVEILSKGMRILDVILITLFINCRHMVYGLSMLDKFKGMGKRKGYMIFSLTDETYALLNSTTVPLGANPKTFYFLIALLNQAYWVAGSLIGSVAGSLIKFNTTGIDFAMTALFVVICTEQWISYPTRIPAIMGAFCALLALIVFGKQNMILPAMLILILLFFIAKNPIENKLNKKANMEVED
jgi:4-azaleucine resistance transporter AzlC